MQYTYVQFFSCDFKIDVKNCVWVLKGDGGDNDACNKTIYIDFKLIIVAFKFFDRNHELYSTWTCSTKGDKVFNYNFCFVDVYEFPHERPQCLISFDFILFSKSDLKKKKSWSHCLLPKLEYVNKLSWDKFDTQREKVRQTSII